MNSLHDMESGAVAFGTEFRKLAAFLRRDVRTAWSYRGAFFADWANILVQVAIFYFVSKIVSTQNIKQYSAGHKTSYIEYVAIGIAFGAFVQSSLSHVVVTIRQEQLMGTLESLLVTPTTTTTLQLGSFVYDLIYVPIRTAVYLTLMVLVFGINLQIGGLLPTMVILVAFIPFAWGLGLISAAGILIMRRGIGIAGIAGTALIVLSAAYFPLTVFPAWLHSIAQHNPLTLSIESSRQALLGGDGWSVIWGPLAVLIPLAFVTIAIGAFAFRRAIKHERRRGTLFLY
jgi:ABC-2 type transport system permease protein